jgi:N-dimethylarginine dimethylaminohydrolase
MDRYLIETPHTHDECLNLLDQILALGYLHNFDWGCQAGSHTGWAIIEAEDEAQASLAVPPMVRGKARVVRLNRFTDEDVKAYHASE